MIGEDGEDDVLCRAAVVKFADEFEANRFGHLDEGEAGADEVGVFGGANAPRESIGSAAHAGVRVGRLDEIANLNEFLSRDLMANARRDTVNGGIVTYARVLLEGHLQIA